MTSLTADTSTIGSLEARFAREVETIRTELQTFGFRAILVALLWTAIMGSAMVMFGLKTKYLRRSKMPEWKKAVDAVVRSFIMPSFFEEVFWRGVMLVRPPAHPPSVLPEGYWFLQSLVPLSFFVAYHVLTGWLLMKLGAAKGAFRAFADKRFLVMCTLLGFGCTLSVWGSGGSLWAPVIVHWLPVAGWLLFFDGEETMRVQLKQRAVKTIHDACATRSQELLLSDTQVKEAFDIFDYDKNGMVSKEELSWALLNLGGDTVPQGIVNWVVQRADTDKDGQISFPEFEAFVTEARVWQCNLTAR